MDSNNFVYKKTTVYPNGHNVFSINVHQSNIMWNVFTSKESVYYFNYKFHIILQIKYSKLIIPRIEE